jgi:hypothetical protein
MTTVVQAVAKRMKWRLGPLVIATGLSLLVQASSAQAAGEPPIKEVLVAHFGWGVNSNTSGATTCKGAECQPAQFSSRAGGFEFTEGVAGSAGGNIYVADGGNHRVQELEHDGTFVLMFGKGVNKKGGDLCVKAEAGECQQGVEGTAPGEFQGLESIAVDPATGNVWTAELQAVASGAKLFAASRVQEFTAEGQFLREIGKEVNETAHLNNETANENVCPVKPGDKCKAPRLRDVSTPYEWGGEPGAFNLRSSPANVLAVNNNTVYVGDESRVQEFDASSGAFIGQIPLAGTAISIAVDKAGDTYLIESVAEHKVRLFDPSGNPVATFAQPAVALSLAVDSAGRLAVVESVPVGTNFEQIGTLYEPAGSTLRPMTHFTTEGQPLKAIAFNGADELYGVNKVEVFGYKPVPVAELENEQPSCGPGELHETNVTFDCELRGVVNPWGVAKTMVWFMWGKTKPPREETIHQLVPPEETPIAVKAPINGLAPNETFYFQLFGEDEHASFPEVLTSPTVGEYTTPTVPPRIINELIATFQTPTTAVLVGRLNPENAATRYYFQYALQSECSEAQLGEGKSLPEACKGVQIAGERESAQYGQIGAVTEIAGLRPATSYRYRLYAVNGKSENATGETGQAQIPEGTFTTAQPPAVTAQTGNVSAVTPISARIAGTVNPGGQASTYSFQMGIANGSNTQYGTVFTGPAGASTTPVEEALTLTGLQPATTYAYRIAIQFGDGVTAGSTAIGETRTFTTPGLPEALLESPPPMLPLPPHTFPTPPCGKPDHKFDKHHKCVKVKHTKRKAKRRRRRS